MNENKSDHADSLEAHPLLSEFKSEKIPLEKLTRAELLDAIKTEVATQEAQNKKAGWSMWVLLVAIGVLGGASLNELRQVLMWPQVIGSLVIFSLLIITWEPLSSILEPGIQKFSKEIRFFPIRILAAFRTEMAALGLRNGILLIAALHLARDWNVGWIPVLFFAWQFFFVIVGILASSSIDLHVPAYRYAASLLSRAGVLTDWVCLFFIALAATKILCEVIVPQPELASIRLGILLAIIFQCLIWLSKSVTPPPFLATLRNLQQDFSFGRISIEEAHRQADITLAGTYLEDILRVEILPVIASLESLKAQQKNCSEHLEKWNKLEENPEKDLDFIANTWRSLEEQMRILTKLENEFNKRYKKLQNKISIFKIVQPTTKAQLSLLMSSFEKSKSERAEEIKISRKNFSDAASLKLKRMNGLHLQ